MTDISSRIETLTSILQAKARKFATPDFTAEDVYQTIVTALIEKSNEDPTFAEKGDGYIINHAEWTARHMNRSSRTYDRYVGEESVVLDDNAEAVSNFEFIVDSTSVEEVSEINERFGELKSSLKGLTPENRKIAYLLFIGYSKAEIAEELKISRPAVSQRIQTIQRQLHFLALQDF